MHQHEWMEDLILSPGLPHRPASSAAPCEEVKCCVYDLWGSLPLLPFLPSSNHSTIVVLPRATALSHCHLPLPALVHAVSSLWNSFPFSFFFFSWQMLPFCFLPFHFCTCIAILLYRYRCSVSLSMQLQGLLPEALQTPHPLSCSERHLTLLLCVGAVCSQPVSTLWVRMDLLPRF